ncbi:unnamed protein product, partial [marine sediment metagenome]
RVYMKYGGAPSSCENANYGEVEDYKIEIVEDNSPPYIWNFNYGAGYVQAGEQAIINVHVYDNYGVSSVYAEIESPDENVLDVIQLFDDGIHND